MARAGGVERHRGGFERGVRVKALDIPRLGRLRQAQARLGGSLRWGSAVGPVSPARSAPKPRVAPPVPHRPEREARGDRGRHWLERCDDARHRLEAHLFAVGFQRLRAERTGPVAALLMAYRQVRGLSGEAVSLSFAQALELAQRAERCEHDVQPWLSTSTCTHCRCDRISLLQGQPLACPFCAVLQPGEQEGLPQALCTDPS